MQTTEFWLVTKMKFQWKGWKVADESEREEIVVFEWIASEVKKIAK